MVPEHVGLPLRSPPRNGGMRHAESESHRGMGIARAAWRLNGHDPEKSTAIMGISDHVREYAWWNKKILE